MTLVFAVACGSLTALAPHEFENGHIERSVKFVVHDHTVHVEYSLGANPTTMLQLLGMSSADQAKVGSSGKEASPTLDDADDAAIEARFRDMALSHVADQLQIVCNGKPVRIQPVSSEISPRHHVNALLTYEFQLPDDRRIEITVSDSVFAQNNGVVRYAVKPRGRAMLLKSDVAPALVRAARINLSGLSPTERRQKTTLLFYGRSVGARRSRTCGLGQKKQLVLN